MKNPNWTRDELILALDLYLSHRDSFPPKNHPDVLCLSEQLTALNKSLSLKDPTFRNPNGVYMKLNNFKSIDPLYTNTGKVGLWRNSKGDQSVWNEFSANPKGLSEIATAIRNNINGESGIALVETETPFANEGKLLSRTHYLRERNPKLVALKKDHSLRTQGELKCEVCGFVFNENMELEGKVSLKSTTKSHCTPSPKAKKYLLMIWHFFAQTATGSSTRNPHGSQSKNYLI